MKQYWHMGDITEQLRNAGKVGLALLLGGLLIKGCDKLSGSPLEKPLDLTPTESPVYNLPQVFADKGININVHEYRKKRFVIYRNYNFDGKLDAVEVIDLWHERITITNNLSAWTNGYEIAKIKAGAKR